jgi:hypothetical protein
LCLLTRRVVVSPQPDVAVGVDALLEVEQALLAAAGGLAAPGSAPAAGKLCFADGTAACNMGDLVDSRQPQHDQQQQQQQQQLPLLMTSASPGSPHQHTLAGEPAAAIATAQLNAHTFRYTCDCFGGSEVNPDWPCCHNAHWRL